MSLSLVLALQAAAAAPPPPAAPLWAMPSLSAGDVPDDFDLARYRMTDSGGHCGAADSGDVLVCGPRRRVGDYPLARWARIFGPEPPLRAEMDLGGGVQGRIHAEAVPMDRGAVSNRVMIGIGTRF